VLLAREGATVAVVDRALEAAPQTVDAVTKEGVGKAFAVYGDVSTPESVSQAVEGALAVLGGVVDGLAIIVGILGDAGTVDDSTVARAAYWDRTTNINLRAHNLLMQELGPLIAKQPAGGSICFHKLHCADPASLKRAGI
jgi:NAD(P)-dependent dehydrogenase (short-subunit alcohol dehydrogenase family)